MSVKNSRKVDSWDVKDRDGRIIREGDTIVDFRGEEAEFVRVQRYPRPGKQALIHAKYPDGWEHDYYASVFGLIVQEGGEE